MPLFPWLEDGLFFQCGWNPLKRRKKSRMLELEASWEGSSGEDNEHRSRTLKDYFASHTRGSRGNRARSKASKITSKSRRSRGSRRSRNAREAIKMMDSDSPVSSFEGAQGPDFSRRHHRANRVQDSDDYEQKQMEENVENKKHPERRRRNAREAIKMMKSDSPVSSLGGAQGSPDFSRRHHRATRVQDSVDTSQSICVASQNVDLTTLPTLSESSSAGLDIPSEVHVSNYQGVYLPLSSLLPTDGGTMIAQHGLSIMPASKDNSSGKSKRSSMSISHHLSTHSSRLSRRSREVTLGKKQGVQNPVQKYSRPKDKGPKKKKKGWGPPFLRRKTLPPAPHEPSLVPVKPKQQPSPHTYGPSSLLTKPRNYQSSRYYNDPRMPPRSSEYEYVPALQTSSSTNNRSYMSHSYYS